MNNYLKLLAAWESDMSHPKVALGLPQQGTFLGLTGNNKLFLQHISIRSSIAIGALLKWVHRFQLSGLRGWVVVYPLIGSCQRKSRA